MKVTEILPLLVFFFGAVAGGVYAIRRIWRSTDSRRWKIAFSLLVAIPWLGLFAYLFLDMPPRELRKDLKQKTASAPVAESPQPTRKHPKQKAAPLPMVESPLLTQWNEQEPEFLTWCGVVFLGCAAVAYWLNGWSPGRIHFGVLGLYTDVDEIFFSLLILAIFAFGGANRAKTYLEKRRKLEMSGSTLLVEGRKRSLAVVNRERQKSPRASDSSRKR